MAAVLSAGLESGVSSGVWPTAGPVTGLSPLREASAAGDWSVAAQRGVGSRPESGAGVQITFCSCRNLGWAAFGARLRMAHSLVVTKPPSRRTRSSAYTLPAQTTVL